jgi:hypothetical protein
MLFRDAATQIAAERRAQALELASHERTARLLRRFRRHAPPVALPAPRPAVAPRAEVREPEAA